MRRISFNVLYDVLFNNKLLNDSFDMELKKNKNLKDEDVAFVKREINGTIEKLEDIDKVINRFSKVKIKKLNKSVLIVLRLAIFEIYYMDKVPNFATVNEFVNIIKKSNDNRLSGYVNAVLRSIVREKSKNIDDITTNMPNLEDRRCYFRIYNNHEEDVLNELNNKKIFFNKYDGDLSFKYAKVYYTKKYKDIIDTECFRNGDILIEDASSIYLTDKLAELIKIREKKLHINSDTDSIKMMKLLDTCAAPGGKILGLIDLIYDDYFYFYAEARDISEEKILKICENVNRLKVLDLNMNVKDASIHDPIDDDKFDVVICDVPCTGLGVVSKKPDIKLNYSDNKRDSLVILQKKILEASSRYIKKGGFLSYSTCTETKEENEDVVLDFLNKNDSYRIKSELKIYHGDNYKSDGFYYCIFERIK